MIRKAVGTVIRRITVTATTNRTIGRLAARMSRTVGPRIAIAMTATTVTTISNGTTVKMTFPGNVNRFQLLPTTVIGRSSIRRAVGQPMRALPGPPLRPRTLGCARALAPRRLRPGPSDGALGSSTGSFVDAAHDRVEARHDRHRVSDEMTGHHQPNGLQVNERWVVDPHPEGLVRAVADGVR